MTKNIELKTALQISPNPHSPPISSFTSWRMKAADVSFITFLLRTKYVPISGLSPPKTHFDISTPQLFTEAREIARGRIKIRFLRHTPLHLICIYDIALHPPFLPLARIGHVGSRLQCSGDVRPVVFATASPTQKRENNPFSFSLPFFDQWR
ncbi:hypothetical protein CEXT_317261 [Caerostris extrusa]|uniref:Uncharacterized protein n=1 Tax=Caerostris extrusa TaxID=172846 RepID=A0AAV4WVL2_CAEEX|nr:hypothetical protein CEXT_317261 [Caerostris extrusa]